LVVGDGQRGTSQIRCLNCTTVIAGSLLLSIAFRLDARWRRHFALSLALALVIGVAFVAWFLAPNALFGLGNKVFFAVMIVWLIAPARHVRTVARAAE
jgi:hypothetical protein